MIHEVRFNGGQDSRAVDLPECEPEYFHPGRPVRDNEVARTRVPLVLRGGHSPSRPYHLYSVGPGERNGFSSPAFSLDHLDRDPVESD